MENNQNAKKLSNNEKLVLKASMTSIFLNIFSYGLLFNYCIFHKNHMNIYFPDFFKFSTKQKGILILRNISSLALIIIPFQISREYFEIMNQKFEQHCTNEKEYNREVTRLTSCIMLGNFFTLSTSNKLYFYKNQYPFFTQNNLKFFLIILYCNIFFQIKSKNKTSKLSKML